MGKKAKVESDVSSSEDEVCMEAIKEAADQDLLKNLLSQVAGKESTNIPNSTLAPDVVDSNENQYSNHGLTQSCRDFIAKKLVEKLNA